MAHAHKSANGPSLDNDSSGASGLETGPFDESDSVDKTIAADAGVHGCTS